MSAVEDFWGYLQVNLEAKGSEHPNAADRNRALFYELCRDYFRGEKELPSRPEESTLEAIRARSIDHESLPLHVDISNAGMAGNDRAALLGEIDYLNLNIEALLAEIERLRNS